MFIYIYIFIYDLINKHNVHYINDILVNVILHILNEDVNLQNVIFEMFVIM